MAYTSVRVSFEIGHEASIRAKKTHEGFTHDWELFVRGGDNSEIHHFVDRVIFHLHETFHNPRRVIKEPPFVVRESGYAGFPLYIEIYFKNKPEPNKFRVKYQLTLPDSGPPISHVTREEFVFNNPAEDFRRKLIKGGGVGVGQEPASGSHMATLNTVSTDGDQKNSANKNKSLPLDANALKKSKKENAPKIEEKVGDKDFYSLFGQPIKTSTIPLVSKSKLISDKVTSVDKQAQQSKPSKHNISSHKEKDKDRDKEKEKEREREKHKSKERDKEKDKTSIKNKSKEDAVKKEKNKEDKTKILKPTKDETKKNAYNEEKPKDKPVEKMDKEVKVEKKDKDDKHKEEKKAKSKEKHKHSEKKENIESKENFGERLDKSAITKDENAGKEEKKIRKIDDEKDDKIEKNKEKAAEPKNVYNDNFNSLNAQHVPSNVENTKKEEKHKHHKHKKDKSKKDSKRDKEERKEKSKESKESKERSSLTPVEQAKSTPKQESPKSIKAPLKRLFEELSDKSDLDTSSLDEEPISIKISKEPSPEIPNPVKEEPPVCAKQEELIKEDNHEIPVKKKRKKSSEEKERKNKRKSKSKEDGSPLKLGKYDNQITTSNNVKQNAIIEMSEPPSEPRQASLSPVTDGKFTDEYITKLRELQRKIMTLDDNSGLQRIVQVVAETGQYEITTKTFDFDLCSLDESIVQRLLDFFVP